MEEVSEITYRNTVALVVLYYPDSVTIAHLERALTQVRNLLVVDNTPFADRALQLWQWGASRESVEFLDNTENRGLGVAYNQGFREAQHQGASWVLILDQDTELRSDYLSSTIERLASVGYRNSTGRPTGIVGVNFLNSAVLLTHVDPNAAVVEVPAVISSGSLVSIAAWNSASGFDEELFIDYVDTDLCMKVKSARYAVVLIGDILMTHGMGNTSANRILGIYTRLTSNYPAFRHYYMARNFIYIAKRHGHSNYSWFIGEGKRRVKFTALSLLMEDNRWQVFHWTFIGVVDGVRGRMGKRIFVEKRYQSPT